MVIGVTIDVVVPVASEVTTGVKESRGVVSVGETAEGVATSLLAATLGIAVIVTAEPSANNARVI